MSTFDKILSILTEETYTVEKKRNPATQGKLNQSHPGYVITLSNNKKQHVSEKEREEVEEQLKKQGYTCTWRG